MSADRRGQALTTPRWVNPVARQAVRGRFLLERTASRPALWTAAAQAGTAGLTADGQRTRSPGLSGGWNAEQLGNIDVAALRATSDITRAPNQGLETMIAGLAVVFVDRHGGEKLQGFAFWFNRILEAPRRVVNAGLIRLTRTEEDVPSVRSGGHMDELPDSSAIVPGSSRA